MTSRSVAAPRSRPGRPIRLSSIAGFAFVHLAALGVFAVGFSWKGVAPLPRLLLPPHVRGHRRLPPLLQPPHLSALRACPSSSWRFSARRRRRRACCGGPPTTATTTSTPTGRKTSTARCRAGSGGATSAGSSRRTNEETDYSRVPDLAKYPELVWLDRHALRRDDRSTASRSPWPSDRRVSSTATSSRPSCSGTAPSRSTA